MIVSYLFSWKLMESTGLQKAEAIATDSYIQPEIGESLCVRYETEWDQRCH